MSPTFSLADQDWIPTITPSGYRDVSLIDAVGANDIVDIDSGDVLADAAIRRLLLACTIAARHADATPAVWVANHAAGFDILRADRPFAQNPDLANTVPADRPRITAQLYDFTSGTGSSGDYTVSTPWPVDATLDFPAAARLLLVRQMFSAGGKGAHLGKYTGTPAITSFQQSLHYNVPFAWIRRPTLAQSLATMADLVDVPDDQIGAFHFTFEPTLSPGDKITDFGLLDVLTYPSRSLYLGTSAGQATTLCVFEGLRLPRADVKQSPEGFERQRAVFRHTLWWSQNDKTPPTPRGVRTADFVREDWRHLLECSRTEGSPSIISPEVALPDDARVLVTALAGDKSRIDNIVNWDLPAPRLDRDRINALVPAPGTKPKDDHSVYGGYRRSSYGLSSVVADRSGMRGQGDKPTDRADARHSTTFDRITRPIILDALAGVDDLERTHHRLAEAHRIKRAIFASDIASVRPLAAAQITAMKTPDWAATDSTN